MTAVLELCGLKSLQWSFWLSNLQLAGAGYQPEKKKGRKLKNTRYGPIFDQWTTI